MRPSRRDRRALVEHSGDFPPAVDPAQLDLTARHKAEEQDQRSIFAGQGPLRSSAGALPGGTSIVNFTNRKNARHHLDSRYSGSRLILVRSNSHAAKQRGCR